MRVGSFGQVNAVASTGRRPQILRLAVQNGGRELAVAVDRGPFPEQKPLDCQRTVARVAMLAGGIAEAVAGSRDGVNDSGVELAARIRERRR